MLIYNARFCRPEICCLESNYISSHTVHIFLLLLKYYGISLQIYQGSLMTLILL